MVEKALKIIADSLSEFFGKKGLTKEVLGNFRVCFKSKDTAYVVKFSGNKFSLIKYNEPDVLKTGSEEAVENAGITLSEWLFDPESNTEKDAETIATDFLELFLDNKLRDSSFADGKKVKDKLENDGLHFFLNRLVTLFPELKPKVSEEKELYVKFRYVTFIKENFVPLFVDLVNRAQEKDDKLRKTINVLNNFYENGNMDVRSTITVVILNSLDGFGNTQKVTNLLSENLQTAFKEVFKYKWKQVKPEKLKKTFLSKLISADK